MPTEPTTTLDAPPASSTPAPIKDSFDAAFPDDGLDNPPEPIKEAAAESPPSPKPGENATTSGKPSPSQGESSAPTAGDTTDKTKSDGAKKPDAPSEPDFTPPQVAKPSELRAWAQRMGTRAQKAEGELQKLHSRITQLESQPPKQAEDTANLASELASAKKQLERYENDLRLTNYERSQEYLTKYQKPYHDAAARAYREVSELIVYEPNPEDPDNPKERAATKADFDEIYGMPLGQASRLAKQKFGDTAAIVLQHRQNVRQLAEQAYQAVEEYKAKAGEHETQTKAQQAQEAQARERMFNAAVEGHAKRSPKLFSERDGDVEGNDLLAKGKSFAWTLFGSNEGLTPQQVAFRDAMAFNRLATYPRLLRDLKKAETDLADAQKTIETLRGSGPGPAVGGGDKQPATAGGSIFDAFDKQVPG